jgi:succinate dehydrogenase / fumarate reductase cytochrome b subunit
MPTRPTSPHLTVYRFMYTMAQSIVHRITGVVQAAGLALLAWWLMALASGPQAYAQARVVLGSPLVKLLLIAWLLAFVYHLCNGLRHLLQDAGWGLEKAQARRGAWITLAAVVIVFVLLGLSLFAERGGP